MYLGVACAGFFPIGGANRYTDFELDRDRDRDRERERSRGGSFGTGRVGLYDWSLSGRSGIEYRRLLTSDRCGISTALCFLSVPSWGFDGSGLDFGANVGRAGAIGLSIFMRFCWSGSVSLDTRRSRRRPSSCSSNPDCSSEPVSSFTLGSFRFIFEVSLKICRTGGILYSCDGGADVGPLQSKHAIQQCEN